ncbi:hypothetical protein LPJ66_007893 [Kickxella alabastrina]|uniref:Uncharacterized protein n=1 Tax=Kickxella alabastrina TaxID=61397 RepID=A0ACC1I916_9FUNG|nr:hypothetical protein LPJ66_007893 [Kickxella alabastrina]
MRFWFLLTLESDIFGHFCDVSKKPRSFIFSQKVDVESKGDSKIEVLYSVSQDIKDIKDGAALFCIKETIARYSYMVGRHVNLFRGKFNGEHDAVLKLSWTPGNRLPEGAAYAILNKRPVECIPKIFSKGLLISNLNGYRLEFVLMEYCGKSMAEYLKGKADDQKDELVPRFVEQLTLCLAQANDTGVLHRDISAGNVCVKNNKVYVIDWGCAKVIGWGTAEDAARDATPTQLNHIDVAKQWGFNATTVGQVEVAKDPFTGTPLFMGIPMLRSSPIRGILDDLESVLYVVMDAVRPASTKRDDVQGFKFLDSPSLAITRWGLIQEDAVLLEEFGVKNINPRLKELICAMRRFLFEPENKVMTHRLWWDKKFVRRANWDAAPEFMHPEAIELLREDNGQLKRPAEDEVNAGPFKKLALWYHLAIGVGAALGTYQLRDTASELLLDMAMRREMLQLIVAQAQGSSAAEEEGRLRTVVLLQVLVMMLQRIGRVVWASGIEALVDAMCAPREKEVAMRAATTLLGLLDTSDAAVSKRHMRQAAGCGFLEIISKALLQSANGSAQGSSKQRQRSDAVLVSVCAAMAKQFALRTEYHRRMIDLAFLPALLGIARQSVSELELLRMLMESLVRLCTFLVAYRLAAAEEISTEVVNPQMVQLLELGAVDIITACVRQDDQGVSSWGIGFLHEFMSRSVSNETTIFKCVNVFSSNYN